MILGMHGKFVYTLCGEDLDSEMNNMLISVSKSSDEMTFREYLA